jgi:hypothetical protein
LVQTKGWQRSGLVFNVDKTRIVSLDECFDFPGFNLRRYHAGASPASC